MENVVKAGEVSLHVGKSMRGLGRAGSLDFDENGMFGDREFMWVEAEPHINTVYKVGQLAVPGQALTQREDPKLATNSLSVHDNGILLVGPLEKSLRFSRAEETADNRIPVKVWDWEGVGVDQGDEVADWGSKQLGRAVRLVAVSNEAPRYVQDDPSRGRLGFSDAYPVTVISRNSVWQLAGALARKDETIIYPDRFRPTIVLNDIEAFGEDRIETLSFTSGKMKVVLHRARANVLRRNADIEQHTGEHLGSVRTTLTEMGRRGYVIEDGVPSREREVVFGHHFTLEMPEGMAPGQKLSLKQEQELEVTYTDEPNWIPS